MWRRSFVKLYEVMKDRVEKEGRNNPDWFLGYLEGNGNKKLSGYQVGALYHLLVLPRNNDPKVSNEYVDNDMCVSGDNGNISVPGLF